MLAYVAVCAAVPACGPHACLCDLPNIDAVIASLIISIFPIVMLLLDDDQPRAQRPGHGESRLDELWKVSLPATPRRRPTLHHHRENLMHQTSDPMSVLGLLMQLVNALWVQLHTGLPCPREGCSHSTHSSVPECRGPPHRCKRVHLPLNDRHLCAIPTSIYITGISHQGAAMHSLGRACGVTSVLCR